MGALIVSSWASSIWTSVCSGWGVPYSVGGVEGSMIGEPRIILLGSGLPGGSGGISLGR